MKTPEVSYSNGYKQGYAEGYQAGVEDMRNGRCAEHFEGAGTKFPIEAMGISTRAKNCLRSAGCRYISDVILLDRGIIARLRNLGCKTAREIAQWLKSQDVPYSEWDSYL